MTAETIALSPAAPRTIPGVSAGMRVLLRAFYDVATRVSPALAARLALALFTTPVRQSLTPEARAILRTAFDSVLEVSGNRLRVYCWPGDGPTILLAHGWSSRAGRLTAFVESLRRAGFEVLAFDAPAHGESSGTQSDILEYVASLRAVIAGAGPVHGIIAHSFGARASLLLAAERCVDLRALALISMPPDVSYILEEFKLVLGLREDVQRLLDRALIARFGGTIDRHDPERHARPVEIPVLLLHDSDDDVAPVAHAIALAQQLPAAQLALTQGLNHCGLLSHGPSIQAVTAFMTSAIDLGRAGTSASARLPLPRPCRPETSAPSWS
ncbi:MAG TPA: alpha/beta hydrolase [Steroidobacteraceae bacterium]|nr:alpha/beta hydrolase [Steroidobacteraceae bacterium]